MWPFRRKVEQPDPGPVWRAAPQAWRTVGPIQRVVGVPPVVNAVEGFTGSLSAWSDPSFLAPLGHRLAPTEPAGVVHDLLRPAPDAEAPAMPLRRLATVPETPVPVQRQAGRPPSRSDGPDASSGPHADPWGGEPPAAASAEFTDAPLAVGVPVVQRASTGTVESTPPKVPPRSAVPSGPVGPVAMRSPAAPPTAPPARTAGPPEPPAAGPPVPTAGLPESPVSAAGPPGSPMSAAGPPEWPMSAAGPPESTDGTPGLTVRPVGPPEFPGTTLGSAEVPLLAARLADAGPADALLGRDDPEQRPPALPVVHRTPDDRGTAPQVGEPDRSAGRPATPTLLRRATAEPAQTSSVSVTSSVVPLIGSAPVGAFRHGLTDAGPAISAVRPEAAPASGVPGPTRQRSATGHPVAVRRSVDPGSGVPGSDPAGSSASAPAQRRAEASAEPAGGSGPVLPAAGGGALPAPGMPTRRSGPVLARTAAPGAAAVPDHGGSSGVPGYDTGDAGPGGLFADPAVPADRYGDPAKDPAGDPATRSVAGDVGTGRDGAATSSAVLTIAPIAQRSVSMPTAHRSPIPEPSGPVAAGTRSWTRPGSLPLAAVGQRLDTGHPTPVQRDQTYDGSQSAPDPRPEPPVETPPEPSPATGATSRPPTAPPPAPPEPDELAKTLFEPLLRRLRTELRLDRERRGMVTDRW